MIYRRLFHLPTWGVRNPFAELDQMRRQMENILARYGESDLPQQPAGVFPAINLTEDKEAYYIRAELPGVKAGDLDIQTAGQNLSISGERKIEAEDKTVKYHRREREAGNFSRIIALPGEIDSEKVSAKMASGILTITIPKAEKAKPRQVAVK
jgi:HSP20 family protein